MPVSKREILLACIPVKAAICFWLWRPSMRKRISAIGKSVGGVSTVKAPFLCVHVCVTDVVLRKEGQGCGARLRDRR